MSLFWSAWQFQMAQDYFQPVAGGILLDVSCGSGLFTRKFANSGTYSAVIALDFSENMLRQCYEFIKQDDTLLNVNLALVRADISRLPFASCSVDAIHAGAAIHCWPSPSNAVAEISRVLKPGGVFVGTTFLSSPRNNPFSVEALRPLRQIVGPVNTSYNYFTEGELEDLCKSCGFVNYSSKVQRSFIMFSGQKPFWRNLNLYCFFRITCKMNLLEFHTFTYQIENSVPRVPHFCIDVCSWMFSEQDVQKCMLRILERNTTSAKETLVY